MSDFLNSLEDNATLAWDAFEDVTDPAAWLSGTAPRTAADVKKQVEARGGKVDPTSIAANGGAGGLTAIGEAVKETATTVATDPGKVVDVAINGTPDSPGGLRGGFGDAVKLVPWWAWAAGAAIAAVVVGVVALPYVGGAKAVLS